MKEVEHDAFVERALGSNPTATNLGTNIKPNPRSRAAKWTYSPLSLPYKGLFSTFCRRNIFCCIMRLSFQNGLFITFSRLIITSLYDYKSA